MSMSPSSRRAFTSRCRPPQLTRAWRQELNERLMISYDVYNRTTSQKHRDCCQLIFNKSQQAGDIYLGSYEGWCVALLGAMRRSLSR